MHQAVRALDGVDSEVSKLGVEVAGSGLARRLVGSRRCASSRTLTLLQPPKAPTVELVVTMTALTDGFCRSVGMTEQYDGVLHSEILRVEQVEDGRAKMEDTRRCIEKERRTLEAATRRQGSVGKTGA